MSMNTIDNPNKNLLKKYDELKEYLSSLESVAVAFSSGVDSTFLLYAAKEALAYCKDRGIMHERNHLGCS